jgi:superfamily II DNA or RNA helicase
MAHMVSGALEKRKRVAVVVPLLNLIDQTFERFVDNGIDAGDMGVMQGNHPWSRPAAPVQICSVQTIASRGFPEADFVVVDEVHMRFKTIEDWIKAEPQKIFVGLSATPWSRGLGEIWDDLIIPTSTKELIAQGLLSRFRVFCPSRPDLTGIKIIAGDYHEGQLSERMSDAKLVGDIVETWLAKADRRPTLVFAVDRAHAATLHERFEAAGVASAYVDAHTPREDRSELAKQFHKGAIEVICSVGTMTTGVDLDVRCIILARPTRSDMLFVQQIGRGLRTAPGKDHLLILDHSDTHLRLGMVTDISHQALLNGREAKVEPIEKKVPLPKECTQCACLVPAESPECPNCGHKPKRKCVEAAPGELVELDVARKTKKAARRRNREMTLHEKADFFGELRGYARHHGFKEGWAANKYRERFSVWPNHPNVRYAPVAPCSMETASWIKSSQIAWIKDRGRRSDDAILNDSLREVSDA